NRAQEHGVPCELVPNAFGEILLRLQDPDQIVIELIMVESAIRLPVWAESGIPESHTLLGFYKATLSVISIDDIESTLEKIGYKRKQESDLSFRYISNDGDAKYIDVIESPDLPQARQGAGSVHHIAFCVPTDEIELEIRSQVHEIGLHPTPVIDRQYFHSVYFMTSGRILFEIATDTPGFAVDEPLESLGEYLVLPPQYEPHRDEIEKALVPIVLPRHNKK
ncbi:MAG: ring-cleaving dioxygenase, partial [Parcubacteria group bacterium]|nr:ring-cleaving dioxygenase [Parcubacteria group bacterium]